MLDIDGLKNKVLGQASSFVDHQFPGLGAKAKVLGQAAATVGQVSSALSDGFMTAEGYHWAGLSQREINAHYRNLHALGIQHKEYYILRFKPYLNNKIKNMPLIENELSGWLATEVSWPMLQVDTESKKIGSHSLNYVTGRQAPDLTISMIETEDNLVIKSMLAMRNAMCKVDGTFGLPSEHSFWIEMYLYGRKGGLAYPKSLARSLCYITQANLEMSSTDGGALVLPLTFTQARPFMRP